MSGSDSTPRRELARLASAVGVYKICFVLLALGAPFLLPGMFSADSWVGNFHWPPERSPGIFSSLETWDAQHYLYLSEEGYGRRRMPIAFFPLFPWLIRAGAVMPGVSPLAAALVLTNVCSLAAIVLLFTLLRRRHPGTEWASLLLLLSFPGALFFQFPFTESLFLLLSVLVFWGFELERYELVAGAAFFLALTRPNGLLILAVVGWDLFSRWREGRGVGAAHVGAVLAPLFGFGFYLLIMRIVAGDAMAGFEMQQAFNNDRSITNLLNVPLLLANLVDVRVIHGISNSLLDRLAFLLVVATFAPLWRLDKRFFWFAVPMALIGPLSGTFMSYTRYAAVIFPTFVVLGRMLGGEERRPWLYTATAVFLLVQVTLLLRHATFHWAG